MIRAEGGTPIEIEVRGVYVELCGALEDGRVWARVPDLGLTVTAKTLVSLLDALNARILERLLAAQGAA